MFCLLLFPFLRNQKRKRKDTNSNIPARLGNPVIVTATAPEDDDVLESVADGQKYRDGSFRKPDGVEVDELFWIKMQANMLDTLLVYDKTRTCQFFIYSGTPGHEELCARICAERGSGGRKTHFMALFDKDSNCKVFPDTADLKSW